MSEFACEVVKIDVEPHPNADRLEVALIGGYRSIIMKGQFRPGDLAVYIPEQAVVPEEMLKEMGLEGKLAGHEKNRVRAIRLRGVVSQGLLYPANDDWNEGDDVTEILGVTKYESPISQEMSGKVIGGAYDRWCFKFDIENIKRRKNLIEPGEPVVMTEKVHGTFMVIGMLPHTFPAEYGVPSRFFVSSKGQFAKGIVFDLDSVMNRDNVYLRAVSQNSLIEKFNRFDLAIGGTEYPLYLLGEVYGVQDLKYGLNGGKIDFRAFDLARMKAQGVVEYADDDILDMALEDMNIKRVPVLYKGPFSDEIVNELTDGIETLTEEGAHMRKGIVVKPLIERVHPRYGRAIVKSVSDDYTFRKNGTEFN